jgi:hypothetical protein
MENQEQSGQVQLRISIEKIKNHITKGNNVCIRKIVLYMVFGKNIHRASFDHPNSCKIDHWKATEPLILGKIRNTKPEDSTPQKKAINQTIYGCWLFLVFK